MISAPIGRNKKWGIPVKYLMGNFNMYDGMHDYQTWKNGVVNIHTSSH